MNVNTRDFGNIEIGQEDIYTVKSPILGFEQYEKFAVITDDEIGDGIYWLQSLEEPSICFILINALSLEEYEFSPTAQMRKHLGEFEEFMSLVYCIAVINNDSSKCTVNKKAPLVFSSDGKIFGQYVLDEDFPIKAPLSTAQNVEV